LFTIFDKSLYVCDLCPWVDGVHRVGAI